MHKYICYAYVILRSFALKWCCVIANDDENNIIISSSLGLTHIFSMITKQLHTYSHAFMPAAHVVLYYTYVCSYNCVGSYI